ncbi:MAG: DUF2958 domain-containing protein [Chitinophagales bacterium]|nr:DUF2958 domain-containing protein [Chitinophagales bacterium]
MLLKNGGLNPGSQDNIPYAKLNLIGTDSIWLLSELYYEKPNIAFGLSFHESVLRIGEINLDDMCVLRGPDSSKNYIGSLFTDNELKSPSVTFDPEFIGKYPMSIYYQVAKEIGYISTDDKYNSQVWAKHLRAMGL